MKRVIAVCVGLVLLCGLACTPEGNQGEWIKVKDDAGNEYEVMVIDSGYVKTDYEWYLFVRYEVRNTGKAPIGVSWENKVVADKEGRLFTAQKGEYAMGIQPLRSSGFLRVEYSLPSQIDINNVWWGLMNKGKFIYRIKLKPRKQ